MKVSIVTIVLNGVNEIEDTIQSVLSQNYPDLEYILIDGGSTDGTLDIIRNYENRLSYWVSENDFGIYDAMNKGIRVASGELIGFLNCGDRYEKDAIVNVIEEYVRTYADVIYGDVVFFSNLGEEYHSYEDLDFERLFYSNQIVHQSIFMRTSLQKENEFDTSYRNLADYKLFLSMYCEGRIFAYVNKPISYFKKGGISEIDFFQSCVERRNIQKEVLCERFNLGERFKKIADGVFFDNMFEMHLNHLPHFDLFVKHITAKLRFSYQKIIIFGTGEVAQSIYPRIGLAADYFIDNDTRKWGTLFFGREICSANRLLEERHSLIVIMNKRYVEAILRQLESLELDETNDIISCYEFATMVEKELYSL